MKDVLTVLTFAIGALFLVAFFSTLKPAAVTAAVGGMERPELCSPTVSPTTGCQANRLATLPWSLAAMVAPAHQDRLLPSH